jgi:hypothetical protein
MEIDERTVADLANRIMQKICAVCPDRNVDATCDRQAEGACTLMAKISPAAQAILKVNSPYMEPYIQAVRDEVCVNCDLRYPDGSCAPRDTDNCMLNSYLPLVVEVIEEHFGKKTALVAL